MSIIQQIKVLPAQGYGVSAIAEALDCDRKTVRKYLQQTDCSSPRPAKRTRASKRDPSKATMDAWLEEDPHQWYTQRHTAQRLFDRLGEECPARAVSYRTVSRYVQVRRRAAPTTGPRQLEWPPGEAPVDFGQADISEQGTLVRIHALCLTFPYRNAGYLQRFRGEHAECVVHGLVALFQHMDGAPQRRVLDNASGGGRRLGERGRMTDWFARFQAHYGFETTFCNP